MGNIICKGRVREKVSLSDTTIWRKCKDGTFPAPIQLSTRRVGWDEDEVDAWLASRNTANWAAPVVRSVESV